MNKTKFILELFLVILVVVIFIASKRLYTYYIGNEKAFEGLRSEGVNLEELYKENKDIVGWVKIDGTKIDYPVMQRPKFPEFYLRRNFKTGVSTAGTPFLQYDSIIGESKNYLIYGHNIKAGTMFHDLLKYEKDSFFKKHKIIHFETLREGKKDYEVIAAFKTETYSFNYSNYGKVTDEETYSEYIKPVRNLNELNNKFNVEYPEQLITLATCSYHVDDHEGRYVVVGKEISK